MREVVILRLYSPASFVKDELHWTDVRQGDGSWKSSLMFPRWSDMVYHGEPCPKKKESRKTAARLFVASPGLCDVWAYLSSQKMPRPQRRAQKHANTH